MLDFEYEIVSAAGAPVPDRGAVQYSTQVSLGNPSIFSQFAHPHADMK